MHGAINTGAAYFAGDLIGFTAGLLITVLLLVLTLRAAKLPGTPLANIVFAVCALLWNAGGLAHGVFHAFGIPLTARLALAAEAVQFSGAGTLPIPILAIWRNYAVLPWQKTASRILQMCAYLSAGAIAAVLWTAALSGSGPWFGAVKQVAFYNTALLLIPGAIVSLRRGSTPRAVYLPSLAIVAGICGASAMAMAAGQSPVNTELGMALTVLGRHLILLVVLCAFFLFARFRYADLFIRLSVRILLAGAAATIVAFAAQAPFLMRLAVHAPLPRAVHVFAITLLATTLLLSFAFADDPVSKLVNRWLFHAADYRSAARQLGERLRGLQREPEIAAAVEAAARDTLALSGARLIPLDALPGQKWPAGILEGEIVEFNRGDSLPALLPLPDVELLIPVASGGRVAHVLSIAPGSARPGLVTDELNFLRAAAGQCGNRLDALREAVLLQQVTEAELRALRAQINPHFLFNSLNTIADLIVRDPARAETMTLRLASVFRHVLEQSSRPLTSIRHEMEFVRTYLHIEEARFGDRLQVEIEVAPEVAAEQIPSLILQPLVENALKHGLGPKPGPGHLWISAYAHGDQVGLRVEDDGIGPGTPNGHGKSPGLGLANVSERLRTLYRDRAGICMEPREAGGSRVTVLIPRGGGTPA